MLNQQLNSIASNCNFQKIKSKNSSTEFSPNEKSDKKTSVEGGSLGIDGSNKGSSNEEFIPLMPHLSKRIVSQKFDIHNYPGEKQDLKHNDSSFLSSDRLDIIQEQKVENIDDGEETPKVSGDYAYPRYSQIGRQMQKMSEEKKVTPKDNNNFEEFDYVKDLSFSQPKINASSESKHQSYQNYAGNEFRINLQSSLPTNHPNSHPAQDKLRHENRKLNDASFKESMNHHEANQSNISEHRKGYKIESPEGSGIGYQNKTHFISITKGNQSPDFEQINSKPKLKPKSAEDFGVFSIIKWMQTKFKEFLKLQESKPIDKIFDVDFNIFAPKDRAQMVRDLLKERILVVKQINFMDVVIAKIRENALPSSVYISDSANQNKQGPISLPIPQLKSKELEKIDEVMTGSLSSSNTLGVEFQSFIQKRRSDRDINEENSRKGEFGFQSSLLESRLKLTKQSSLPLKEGKDRVQNLSAIQNSMAFNGKQYNNLGSLEVLPSQSPLKQSTSTQTVNEKSQKQQKFKIFNSGIQVHLDEQNSVKKAIDRHILFSKTSNIISSKRAKNKKKKKKNKDKTQNGTLQYSTYDNNLSYIPVQVHPGSIPFYPNMVLNPYLTMQPQSLIQQIPHPSSNISLLRSSSRQRHSSPFKIRSNWSDKIGTVHGQYPFYDADGKQKYKKVIKVQRLSKSVKLKRKRPSSAVVKRQKRSTNKIRKRGQSTARRQHNYIDSANSVSSLGGPNKKSKPSKEQLNMDKIEISPFMGQH